MRRGLLVLLFLLLPWVALADGGVYIHKTAIAQNVTIPDQQAIICWSNGVERLAIQTQFAATGTNFAWIVPLPSKPVIEEATTGVFSTLEYLFRPNLVHDLPPLYAIILVCTGLGFLALTVQRNSPPRLADTIVALAIAVLLLPTLPCAAVGLAILLPYSVWAVRTGREQPWAIVAVFIIIFVLGAMLLPTLGGGKVQPAANEVSVLSQQTVGIYDTATIAAKDPEALREWLDENGYVLPLAANAVVSNYVKRGWVFAAAKVRRDSANESTNAPHPLCFTFASDIPIYPMQLTAIGNPQLKVDLFVFGPSRASAKNFQTERCAQPHFLYEAKYDRGSTELRIAHPVIRQWAGNLPVATKLSATLSQQMMADDVEITWLPFKEKSPDVFSRHGAIIFALNWGAAVFAAGLLLASAVTEFKRDWQPQLKWAVLLLAACSLLVAASIYATVTKTEIHLVRFSRIIARHRVQGIGKLIGNSQSVTNARALIESFKVEYPSAFGENLLLGGLIHEEDSPGNYVLRESTNGVQFVWFDEQGGEHTDR